MVQCKCHGHIPGVECTYHSTGLAIHTDTFSKEKKKGKKKSEQGNEPKPIIIAVCR